mgnify:CR=1 FL=1
MRIQIIQKLIDKLRGKEARLKKTTEVVKQYRFIHIMFNDKFGKAWVDFVNKNFDTEEYYALFFIVENTAKLKNSNHWHYRSAEFYKDLFKPINLKLETTYDDANEEISVMCGR